MLKEDQSIEAIEVLELVKGILDHQDTEMEDLQFTLYFRTTMTKTHFHLMQVYGIEHHHAVVLSSDISIKLDDMYEYL